MSRRRWRKMQRGGKLHPRNFFFAKKHLGNLHIAETGCGGGLEGLWELWMFAGVWENAGVFFGQGFFKDKDADVAAAAAVVHGVEVSNPSSFLEIPTLYYFF